MMDTDTSPNSLMGAYGLRPFDQKQGGAPWQNVAQSAGQPAAAQQDDGQAAFIQSFMQTLSSFQGGGNDGMFNQPSSSQMNLMYQNKGY